MTTPPAITDAMRRTPPGWYRHLETGQWMCLLSYEEREDGSCCSSKVFAVPGGCEALPASAVYEGCRVLEGVLHCDLETVRLLDLPDEAAEAFSRWMEEQMAPTPAPEPETPWVETIAATSERLGPDLSLALYGVAVVREPGAPRLDPDRPTVDAVRPLVDDLYSGHGAGCCLHIVLDDGNIDDSSVEWCLNLARERGHTFCEELAGLLLRMSKTQRKKLAYG